MQYKFFFFILNLFFSFTAQAGLNCKEELLKIYKGALYLSHSDSENIDTRNLYTQIYEKYFEHHPDSIIRFHNNKVESALRNFPLPDNDTSQKISLNESEANQLMQSILKVKSVDGRLNQVLCPYDPKKQVLFCFGIVYAAHRKANEMGLHPDSILKLWILGPFPTGNWTHHVSLIVRASKGGWWTFDPMNSKQPVLLKDYLKELAETRLVILPTHPHRLLSTAPNGQSNYSPELFDLNMGSNIRWKEFFEDSLIDIDPETGEETYSPFD